MGCLPSLLQISAVEEQLMHPEAQRFLSELASGISASPSEENVRYFDVMILGPTQSPYDGEDGVEP